MKYTYVNVPYSDINKFIRAIGFVWTDQISKSEGQFKPCFDSEMIEATQKRDRLYSRYKKAGLETAKDKFKTSQIFLPKMLYRNKSSYNDEKLV